MRKGIKKKIQGEFYVDSDPEKEEIKGAVDTKEDESKADLPIGAEGEEEKKPDEPIIS